MDTLKQQFGARIKEIREKCGINQEQLAEIVNMESRHLSRIETGKSFTTLENIKKIANALNVDVETLFAFSHKQERKYLIKEINSYLEQADDKMLELTYKIIKNLYY